MSLFGENRFKNLTAEYVEEQYAQYGISLEGFFNKKPNAAAKQMNDLANSASDDAAKQRENIQKMKELQAKQKAAMNHEAKDVSVNDDFDVESVDEASYIDALLEALDD